MSMFEAYLKETNQTKEDYEKSVSHMKYDNNNTIPVVIPLFTSKIKCSQLKISKMIVDENTIWTNKNKQNKQNKQKKTNQPNKPNSSNQSKPKQSIADQTKTTNRINHTKQKH